MGGSETGVFASFLVCFCCLSFLRLRSWRPSWLRSRDFFAARASSAAAFSETYIAGTSGCSQFSQRATATTALCLYAFDFVRFRSVNFVRGTKFISFGEFRSVPISFRSPDFVPFRFRSFDFGRTKSSEGSRTISNWVTQLLSSQNTVPGPVFLPSEPGGLMRNKTTSDLRSSGN